MMSRLGGRIGRAINAFVGNPDTYPVKGLILSQIGLADASWTLREDIARGQLRVGHGLVIIGLFKILDALPHLLGGLKAGGEFPDRNEESGPPKGNPRRP